MLFLAVQSSGDTKTGPIPVVYAQEDKTCPTSCPLKGGACYARFHHVGRVWKRLNAGEESKTYLSFERLLSWVGGLIDSQPWRYGVAGDLPHTGDGKTIDAEKLEALVKANRKGKKRGFAYTHHKPGVAGNAEAIKAANDGGFTVNLSADNLGEADELAELGIAPVVTMMPQTERGRCHTPAGRLVVECPASNKRSKIKNCVECKFICWRADRDFIVGFVPHGSAKKTATKIMEGNA